MSWSHVSGNQPAVKFVNSTTSAVQDFASAVTSGNSVFVAVSQYRNAALPDVPTVTGEGGQSFGLIGTSRTITNGADNMRLSLFALHNATGGSAWTVTVSTTNAGDITFTQSEFSGADATPNDANNGATGTSTAPTCSVVTNTANDLLIGAFNHIGSDRALTSGSGFTLLVENEGGSSNAPIHVEYQVATVANTYTVDGTITGSIAWAIVGGSFKEASAGGGVSLTPDQGVAVITGRGVSMGFTINMPDEA